MRGSSPKYLQLYVDNMFTTIVQVKHEQEREGKVVERSSMSQCMFRLCHIYSLGLLSMETPPLKWLCGIAQRLSLRNIRDR